jgi:hypothetical protein
MLFKSAAFIALASTVFGASVQLTAQGDDINTPVTFNANGLTLNDGSVATIDIDEPSGFATVDGKYLLISPSPAQIVFVGSQGEASKDFGVVDGLFRNGPSSDNTVFYACPATTGFAVSKVNSDGCKQVKLVVGGAAPAPSSEAPAPAPSSEAPAPAPSSEAPAPSSEAPVTSSKADNAGTATVTEASTVTSSIISCENDKCSATQPEVLSHNGAGNLAVGAGAAVFAGIAALL